MSATVTPLEAMGLYAPPQRVIIASIYPKDLVTDIARRAPVNKFTIPTGSKQKPAYLVVEDTWESGSTFRSSNVRILAEHTATHIVNDHTVHLLHCNAAQRAWPGVFICAGETATAEEIGDAEECQRRYFTILVNAARELERQEKRKEVQPDMYMAGRELGIVGEKWQNEISKDAMKKCVWCDEFIGVAARRCGKCSGFQSEADAQAFAAQTAVPSRPIVPPVAKQEPQPAKQ